MISPVRRRRKSIDVYAYSPTGAVSTGSVTPDLFVEEKTTDLFDFVFTVGVAQWPATIGVCASVEPGVLETVSNVGGEQAPIESSIAKFIFPKNVQVVKLDALHAAARYLLPSSSYFLGHAQEELFAFTVGRQSVVGSSGRGQRDSSFCYVMKFLDIEPFGEDFAVITPIARVIVSQKPFVDLFYQLLRKWRREQLVRMQNFWSGNSVANDPFRLPISNSPPPGGSSVVDDISVSRPPVNEGRKLCEKCEFFIPWFSIDLVALWRKETMDVVLIALLAELKVMVVSSEQTRRANAVLGLVGILGDSLRWPHPCLASPPEDIALELPNAPTPVLAAVPASPDLMLSGKKKSRMKKFDSTIFVNIDGPGQVYWFSLHDAAKLYVMQQEWSALRVDEDKAESNPERIEWIKRQRKVKLDVDVNVDDEIRQIDIIRAKLDLLTSELVDAVTNKNGANLATFQDACKYIDQKFPQSEIRKSVFRSQAFQVKLQHIASRLDSVPEWLFPV